MPFSLRPFRRFPVPFLKLPLASWFLITLLVLSSAPAYAEWEVISSSKDLGGHTAYVDPDTIRRKGNLAKMWVLFDLKTERTLAGITFLSSKGLGEYDCTEEQSRTIASYQYAGQMGNGEIVDSNIDPRKWEPIIPGSVNQALLKVACGKK
jgi:hypothetical protein